MNTPPRFSPYRFRGGRSARNRVVVPPMASETADAAGFATAETIRRYEGLAASGAGIVFVEYSFVHASGRGEDHQLAADADDKIPGLRAVARAIQRAGALAGLQLVHVGGKTTRALAGGPLQSPSGVPVPVKGWQPDASSAMSLSEIAAWKRWFVDAARRAAAAGFDIVELHAAHGYGLNQWLSPLMNKRTDAWGGEGRDRLLLEIASAIRAEVPGILLAVRVPGQDHIEGGLSREEMGRVARRLEDAGADLLDVSSGIGGWRRPEGRAGQGYLVDDAAFLKRFTSLPIVGVGGIQDGEFVDSLVAAGRVDFAAVGRAILEQPRAWGERNLEAQHA